MKAYWHYLCEYGHSWTVMRDYDDAEAAADAVCPAGHEAVTLQKSPLLDAVQVAIRPAGQIVDVVKKQVGHENEFYLVVKDVHTETERSSVHTYTWPQIKVLLDRFRNLPASLAWKELDRMEKLPVNQSLA
jgi:hypothetical protein